MKVQRANELKVKEHEKKSLINSVRKEDCTNNIGLIKQMEELKKKNLNKKIAKEDLRNELIRQNISLILRKEKEAIEKTKQEMRKKLNTQQKEMTKGYEALKNNRSKLLELSKDNTIGIVSDLRSRSQLL